MNKDINWNLNIKEKVWCAVEKYACKETLDISLHSANVQQNFNWLFIRPINYKLRKSGWKLHVSASLQNASDVLDGVLPILIAFDVCFKVTETMSFLAYLNHNAHSLIQAGKFITIYPNNDKIAIKLAKALDQATLELKSPRILSDRQYGKDSIIYYRWGSFSPDYIQTLWGTVLQYIEDPHGNQIFDLRKASFDDIKEAIDPFVEQSTNNIMEKNINPVMLQRYWKCAQINQGVSSEVFFGIDLLKNQRCILKVAYNNSFLDVKGNNAIQRAMHEKSILDELKCTGYVPIIYDSFYNEQQDYVLIMEDVVGDNLYKCFFDPGIKDRIINEHQLNNIINQLIEVMITIHDYCIIHADLKLDSFILTSELNIKIIDFNSSCNTKNNIYFYTCGSPGFASLARLQGERPTVSDDIYSFGTILYYILTNTHPVFNPIKQEKEIINPCVLNVTLHPAMGQLILNCLNLQFTSFAEIKKQFFTFYNKEPIQISSYDNDKYISGVKDKCLRDKTNELVGSFVKYALHNDNNFAYVTTDGQLIHDIRGSAGCILGLSHYLLFNTNNEINVALQQNWQILAKANLNYNSIPGLYVGDSGSALALLYCGLALNNQLIIEHAKQKLEYANKQPYLSVDLYNGIAGRLRVNCIFWKLFGPHYFKQCAISMFEYLNKTAILEGNEIYWYNPTVNSTENNFIVNKKEIVLGYAHGVAGIADTMLDYYLLSHDQQALEYINKALFFLFNIAKSTLNGKEILWSNKKDGELSHPFWCNGSAGIARFFIRAFIYNINNNGLSIAKKVALTVAREINGSLPILCHGIAGGVDYLLDVYTATNDKKFIASVYKLEQVLESWIKTLIKNNFAIDNPHFQTLDYMTGVPGILSSYVRMQNPTTPTLISIEFAAALKEQINCKTTLNTSNALIC